MPEGNQSEESKRLFIGTMLSAEQAGLLSAFFQRNEQFTKREDRGLSWTRTEKLHLTWYFLGNTQNTKIPLLISTLEAALRDCPKTSLVYEHIDFFPSRDNARLLALLPTTIPHSVYSIAAAIRKGLMSIGFFDNKNFRPHITMGRFKKREKAAENFSTAELQTRDLLPLEQQLAEVCLIESKLGKTQNDYAIIRHFPLSKRQDFD